MRPVGRFLKSRTQTPGRSRRSRRGRLPHDRRSPKFRRETSATWCRCFLPVRRRLRILPRGENLRRCARGRPRIQFHPLPCCLLPLTQPIGGPPHRRHGNQVFPLHRSKVPNRRRHQNLRKCERQRSPFSEFRSPPLRRKLVLRRRATAPSHFHRQIGRRRRRSVAVVLNPSWECRSLMSRLKSQKSRLSSENAGGLGV